jgi:hypothetical protein
MRGDLDLFGVDADGRRVVQWPRRILVWVMIRWGAVWQLVHEFHPDG